jgi:hypothetical protein
VFKQLRHLSHARNTSPVSGECLLRRCFSWLCYSSNDSRGDSPNIGTGATGAHLRCWHAYKRSTGKCYWIVLRHRYLGLMSLQRCQKRGIIKRRDPRLLAHEERDCTLYIGNDPYCLRKHLRRARRARPEFGIEMLEGVLFEFGFDSDCLHKHGNVVIITTVNHRAGYSQYLESSWFIVPHALW